MAASTRFGATRQRKGGSVLIGKASAHCTTTSQEHVIRRQTNLGNYYTSKAVRQLRFLFFDEMIRTVICGLEVTDLALQ